MHEKQQPFNWIRFTIDRNDREIVVDAQCPWSVKHFFRFDFQNQVYIDIQKKKSIEFTNFWKKWKQRDKDETVVFVCPHTFEL